MELKLKSNTNLKLYDSAVSVATDDSSTVSDNFKQKVSGMMITECPNIDALAIFDAVSTYQTGSGRTKNLKNIRIQLAPHSNGSGGYFYSCTGNYDKLVSYTKFGGTSLSGYDVDGLINEKPALVGTWGVTDYIDSTMANNLTSVLFQSQSPIVSADYIIDWNNIAVQSVDSTKINYNPAAAIILNSKGLGHIYENTDHFDGKWWITKDEVGIIKDVGTWFKEVTGVKDTYGIVDSTSADGYKLSDLNALSGFTSVSSFVPSAFSGNSYLVSLRFPSTIKSIPTLAFVGCSNLSSIGDIPTNVSSVQASAFAGCNKLESITTLGNAITEIEDGAFYGCTKLAIDSLPSNLNYVSNSAFKDCTSISVSAIPSSVCYIGQDAFNGCTGMTNGIKLNRGKTRTNILSGAFDGTTGDITIGDLDSAWLDEKLKREYESDENWSAYSSRLKSYYKKYYGSVIDSTLYEIQDYICSDGISNMALTNTKMTSSVKFIADVSFCGTPANSGDSIHGTVTEGLKGKVGAGLLAQVGGDTFTIRSSSDYDDGTVHNYWIDQKSFTIGMDGEEKFESATKAVMTTEPTISFFGNESNKFIGASWMNRVINNGVVAHEYVPVKRISDNKLGFYDVITNSFIAGGDYYTSVDTQLGSHVTVDSVDYELTTESGDKIIL